MMVHWYSIGYLAAALVLSLVIGAEREFFAKPAGMRTTALVGLGSCLFTVVSREGIWLLPGMAATAADGSRVAAQIVSGIGFLGAGLIFVRRDAVRGLTTAAGVWFVAAIGMACGAGVVDLAVAGTILYLIITVGIRPLGRRLPQVKWSNADIKVRYLDGHGVLRVIMETAGSFGVKVADLHALKGSRKADGQPTQRVVMHLQGDAIPALVHDLTLIEGVLSVSSEFEQSADDSRKH